MLTIKDAPERSRLGILRTDIKRIVEQTIAQIEAEKNVKQAPSHPKENSREKTQLAGTCFDK